MPRKLIETGCDYISTQFYSFGTNLFLQLFNSVLALEELSKSYWVEHYYYSSITNSGFPDKEFEQEWLNLLYFHPRKQKAFFGWGLSRDYSSKFIKMVENGELELKKQKATYVGLRKHRRVIDVNGKVSLPTQIV